MLIADALILIWDRTAVALQLLGRNVPHLMGLLGSREHSFGRVGENF